MNFAFLYSSFPKWSETFLRQDLTLLLEQNLPVQAISLFSGDCEPQADWPKAIVLHPTSPSSHTPSASTKAFPLPQHLRAWISLLKHHRLLDSLCATLKQLGTTHLHAEFADLPALLAAQAAKRLDISYSVGIHAFDIHCAKYPAAFIFNDARFITACNQAAADALTESHPSLKSKITIIHHGIDLQKWTFEPCQPTETTCKIVFVGRLVPKKGLDILIQALAFLKKTDMFFHLDVVGSGPLEEELKALAKQQQVEDFIHWHGIQPPEGVRAILRQSSCLCAPSVVAPNGDRDGIPNTVLEAMAAGLPVIATQVGGITEALSNNRGWIIDFLSPLQLANTLTAFAATSLEERQRRTQNARKLIESDFDARKLAHRRANLFLNGKL